MTVPKKVKIPPILRAERVESVRQYWTTILDPVHFYTAPALAWNAALKRTGVRLELLTQEKSEMYRMFESGMRGGISTCIHRHAKANNKYMSNFDPEKDSSYIEYLDANNLYGWAMSHPLPISGFQWIDEGELENWQSLCVEGKGCVLEVDLEYPLGLHDLHNDLPLAPERLKPECSNVKKLIPNLRNKERYVVHHITLKTYVRLGLKITKIHRGVVFNESAWLKPYIEHNTNLRTLGKNDFEKDFFKLMNNSVFGKTMENVRNRVNIQVALNDNFKKLVKKPTFKGRKILRI